MVYQHPDSCAPSEWYEEGHFSEFIIDWTLWNAANGGADCVRIVDISPHLVKAFTKLPVCSTTSDFVVRQGQYAYVMAFDDQFYFFGKGRSHVEQLITEIETGSA